MTENTRTRTWLARCAVAGVVATGFPVLAATEAAATGGTGRIAFQSDRTGDLDIYVADPDGTDAVAVASSPAADMDPVWSPDGTTLAFMTDRDGNMEVYTVGVDGSGLTRLTNDAASDETPSWSPDGTKIAYGHGTGFARTIWTMNADGTGKAAVPNAPASAGSPVWSPDGGKLAFTAWDTGSTRPDVWTINVNGTGLTKVTDSACDSFHPKWSPDGSQLLFDRYCGVLGSVIAVAPAAGGPVVTVPGVSGWAYAPNWLPDAFTIVFARAEWTAGVGFSGADVYQVGLDGTGLTQLTNDAAWDDDPSVDTGDGSGLPEGTSTSLSTSSGSTSGGAFRTSTLSVRAGAVRPVRLSARLTTKSGTAIAGQKVTLYARRFGSRGAWTRVGTATTDAYGRAMFAQRPMRSTTYVVTHWTTPSYGASVSGARTVLVRR